MRLNFLVMPLSSFIKLFCVWVRALPNLIVKCLKRTIQLPKCKTAWGVWVRIYIAQCIYKMNEAIINAIFAFVFLNIGRLKLHSLHIFYVLFVWDKNMFVNSDASYIHTTLRVFSAHFQALILLYLRGSFEMEIIIIKK